MSDSRFDYDPASWLPGADNHDFVQDLPAVGPPPGGQWHNSEGLGRDQDERYKFGNG